MRISSIFTSLDGEVTHGGPLQWAVFIRTGGCNLRCWKSSGYCDTPYALDINHRYQEMGVGRVFEEARKYGIPRFTITGGEPLLQQTQVEELSWLLTGRGYEVSLETSGSIAFQDQNHVMPYTCVVMDLKPPSTEMHEHNKFENLSLLRGCDYVKVVVTDLMDLLWLKRALEEQGIFGSEPFNVAIGPRMAPGGEGYWRMHPSAIVDWMRLHKLWKWRLNLQLHRVIWPNPPSLPQGKKPEDLSNTDYQNMEGAEV